MMILFITSLLIGKVHADLHEMSDEFDQSDVMYAPDLPLSSVGKRKAASPSSLVIIQASGSSPDLHLSRKIFFVRNDERLLFINLINDIRVKNLLNLSHRQLVCGEKHCLLFHGTASRLQARLKKKKDQGL